MKLLRIILASYLMLLYFIPCNDHNHIITTSNNIVVFQSGEQPNHQHNEPCSPLCTCSCCNSISALYPHSYPSSISLPLYFHKDYAIFQSQYTPNYIGQIWQPPKIG